MQMCPECSANNKDTARFCIRCGAPLRRLRGQGTVLHGRYRLERVLGCGGMGAVYLATDLRLNARVAIKENLDMSPESQQQFATEAKILARLRHPNLPRVQDFFVAYGRQYLVMDYIAGESLEDIVSKRGPLSAQQAIRWLSQVMDAVKYLHSQNPPVIHRDIKPANIKISHNGKAYLVDFGIAKVLQVGSRTQAGARAVTPGYSPPEQYGAAPTDQRSDIYALGATLYFALTGRVPPEAIERLTGRTDKLVPPRSLNPLIPPDVERVILKAMRINREERFSSVSEMLQALATALPSAGRQVPKGVPSAIPSAPPPTPSPTPFPPISSRQFAPLWLRGFAFLLDVMVWGAAVWLLTLGYVFLLSQMSDRPFWWVWSEVERRGFFPATLFFGFPIYRFLAHAFASSTIGKAMLGLRLSLRNGRDCGFWRALLREVALFFALIPCGFGVLWAALDPYKQGWHDMIAGTFVIRTADEGEQEPRT